MSLPYQHAKPNWTEARIRRAREAKARRYLRRFFDQMRAAGVKDPEHDKDALAKALELVRAASTEQWKKLAEDMTAENWKAGVYKKEDPPSVATFECIVRQIEQAVKNIDYLEQQAKEDAELMQELLRQRGTGCVGADKAWTGGDQ